MEIDMAFVSCPMCHRERHCQPVGPAYCTMRICAKCEAEKEEFEIKDKPDILHLPRRKNVLANNGK
jgi:hypothetical protein